MLKAHQRAGRRFQAAGAGSFVREQGDGPAVVCIHGMIGTSFLYRKMLAELAARGLRGVAFDLPGFGLADRPADYDYSWTGLGRFCTAAVDELGLDRFHLVVHDIGGPVGFELATAMPARIASLALLNTTIDVTDFKSPWTMEGLPTELPGLVPTERDPPGSVRSGCATSVTTVPNTRRQAGTRASRRNAWWAPGRGTAGSSARQRRPT